MKAPWIAALLLGGCMMNAENPPETGAGECKAEAAQTLVGAAATPELGKQALKLTGARTIRWIAPGQAVTMDYRQDRLNIATDAANKVERISCG